MVLMDIDGYSWNFHGILWDCMKLTGISWAFLFFFMGHTPETWNSLGIIDDFSWVPRP
jgi:hypothetical protein